MAAKKILIWIGISLGSFILLACLSLLLLSLLFGDKVKKLAIDELNKRLITEARVNGEIGFSLFSHFPYGAVTFNDISIDETLLQKEKLVTCEKVSLLFNIWKLLSKNYVLEKVTAENGMINVRADSSGNYNYHIFKESENNTSEFSLRISNAELRDFTIRYSDLKNQQLYSFRTQKTELRGDFSSSKLVLEAEATAVTEFLKIRGIDFLPNSNLVLKGNLVCDLSSREYRFENSAITVNGTEFIVTGKVTALPAGNDMQLKISAEDISPGELISLLPQQYAQHFSEYTSDGNLTFTFNISGIQSKKSSPLVTASYKLEKGTLTHQKVSHVLKDIYLEGTYSNGINRNRTTSEISVRKFKTSIDGNEISGSLTLRNLYSPVADFMVDGSVQLSKIYPLLKVIELKSMDGIVRFQQCYFRGPIAKIGSAFAINQMDAGGKFELIDIKIKTENATYERLNGNFEIKNNTISFGNCAFTANQSDLSFEGQVSNLFPFIISSLDSGAPKQKLGLNVTLASRYLNWEDLVGKSSAPSSDDYSIPSLFYLLTGSVNGNVQQLKYMKFNASDIQGKVYFLPGNIYFNDISMNAEQGTVSANGKLDISNPAHSRLELTSSLKGLNISQLFYEFNDFNQTTLTHKNIKGIASADISLESTWDDNRLNKNKLHAVADISIVNGQLSNFEPMLALAAFIKVNELRSIHFSQLQNQLEIKQQKVFIPSMKIFSNALNVQLSGSHDFNNIIDYKVQLNLLRLLTDRFRKSGFDSEAADQSTEGFLNLYLTMTGPAADPIIRYDKKAVKQKIATDIALEKNQLKDVLKKEFNSQEVAQQNAREWQSNTEPEYFQFEDSAQSEGNTPNESLTKQNQKDAFDNFRNLFKKTAPK